MPDELTELYQQLFLDDSNGTRNFRILTDANRSAQGTSPTCGDRYTRHARMDSEVVQGLTFQGSSGAISKASASLLSEILIGKTKAELKVVFDKVRDLLITGHSENDLGKLSALARVYRFPERIKCAMLPWHAVAAAVEGRGETISTEPEKEYQ
jgi:nitrogen fixation NifU-like protein